MRIEYVNMHEAEMLTSDSPVKLSDADMEVLVDTFKNDLCEVPESS